VAWEPARDNVAVVAYYVSVDGGARTLASSLSSTTVRELAPGKPHTIDVSARDSAGNFSGSARVDIVTLVDREAPTPPTNLEGVVSAYDGFFRWRACTDNSGEAKYELDLDDSTTPFSTTSFNRTQAAVTPLELPAGAHKITVRARDRAGNLSGPSNALSVVV
jgi:hypothetical protein